MRLTILTTTFIILLSNLNLQVFAQCDVYQEENGILVMEAENADYSNTNWVFRNDTDIINYVYDHDNGSLTSGPHEFQYSFVGAGFIEYQGDDSFSEPDDNAITYTFQINTPGTYNLIFRGYKNHIDPSGPNPITNTSKAKKFASDRNNDVFLKVEGDYEANTTYARWQEYTGAEKSHLTSYTKFICYGDEEWDVSGRLETGHNPEDRGEAYYRFKAGETYTISIIGRSNQYNIDQILLLRLLDENDSELEIQVATSPSGNPIFRSVYQVYASGYKYRGDRTEGRLIEGSLVESPCVGESGNGNNGGNDIVPGEVITPTVINVVPSNLITPNGDGQNDFWQIENLSGDYQIRVFSKNGQIVYETDNYNQNWGGIDKNGNSLQAGVYYYSIVVSESQKPTTGYITIVY